MNKIQLKPVKFCFPFRFFEVNLIVYVNINKDALLSNKKVIENESKNKEIK